MIALVIQSQPPLTCSRHAWRSSASCESTGATRATKSGVEISFRRTETGAAFGVKNRSRNILATCLGLRWESLRLA